MATKSKLRSLSARRSSPRTRFGAMPEPISSPRSCSRFVPEPDSSPVTDGIPRTPSFPLGDLTPVVGTPKSVSLSDWWLTKKANDKGLGVSGFESNGGFEVRQFSSGSISERHNSSTLETSDGITVCISGFINRSRTLQNGFSSEVCNRFLLGFPYNWKEESVEEAEEKKHFSISFDDIPVNRLHDLLLTSSPSFKNVILDDVVNSLRDLVCPGKEKESDKKHEKSRMDDVVDSLSDLVCPLTEKSDKKCEKSRMDDDDDDESLVPGVVGVKTRGMLKRREGCLNVEKSGKKSEKTRMDDNDDESLVPRVVGVETRGMLKRREEDEASVGKRVHTLYKKKRSREKT